MESQSSFESPRPLVEPAVRPAAEHVRRAFETFVTYVLLKAAAQKSSARKISFQLGANAALGLLILGWAELALYFGLKMVMPAYGAALLTLLANGIAMGLVNLFAVRWRRQDRLDSRAELKKEETFHELQIARHELGTARDELVETVNEAVRKRVVEPYERYKVPVAVGVTFVTGLLVARALLPRASRRTLYEGDVRGLI